MNRLLTEIRRLAADVAARPRPNLYAKALLTLYFGAKQRGDGKHLKGIWFLVCMMSALLEVRARGEPLDPDLFPVETDPPNPEQENRALAYWHDYATAHPPKLGDGYDIVSFMNRLQLEYDWFTDEAQRIRRSAGFTGPKRKRR